MEEKCYWCGKQATTREHVPPKCLFPEIKDIKNVYHENFRQDLITVPSCDEHNNSKSGDDEFLFASLSLAFGANGIAYYHSHTKLGRTFSRNPGLINSYFNIKKDENIKIGNFVFPISYVEIDTKRILHCFEAIARGLYFYEFKDVFIGRCSIFPLFFKYEKYTVYQIISILLSEQECPKWESKGANPKIFKYQFSPIDQFGLRAMKMTFYGGIEVLVSYIPTINNLPETIKNNPCYSV